MTKYSSDKIIRIYNDDTGDFLEIRPSSDGFKDNFELNKHVDRDVETIYFTLKELPLIIQALEEMKTSQYFGD